MKEMVNNRVELEKVLSNYIMNHNALNNEEMSIKMVGKRYLMHVKYNVHNDKGYIYGTYTVKYGKSVHEMNGSFDMVDKVLELFGY